MTRNVPKPNNRKFLRAVSHDFKEPVNTLQVYLRELSDIGTVKKDPHLKSEVKDLRTKATALRTNFHNFYEAFKSTSNSLKFKKEMENNLARKIKVLSEDWKKLNPKVSHLSFNDLPNVYVSDISTLIDRIVSRHTGLLRYLDVSDKPEKVYTDVRNEVFAVTKDLTGILRSEGLPLHSVKVVGSCEDNFDRVLLSLIFQNLLTNSIKYRRIGTNFKVKIGLFQVDYTTLSKMGFLDRFTNVESNRLYNLFLFEDNGRGIPKNYHKTIFKPYKQLKRDRESYDGGAGMGLAIVSNAIEVHEGQISIESVEGLGTRFEMLFPRSRDRNIKFSNQTIEYFLQESFDQYYE